MTYEQYLQTTPGIVTELPSKAAQTSQATEILEQPANYHSPFAESPKKSRWPIILLVAIIIGGASYYWYTTYSGSKNSHTEIITTKAFEPKVPTPQGWSTFTDEHVAINLPTQLAKFRHSFFPTFRSGFEQKTYKCTVEGGKFTFYYIYYKSLGSDQVSHDEILQKNWMALLKQPGQYNFQVVTAKGKMNTKAPGYYSTGEWLDDYGQRLSVETCVVGDGSYMQYFCMIYTSRNKEAEDIAQAVIDSRNLQ
ncbi:flagellar basal body-associated FliL family protein [Chitinophaga skermanii]|nr:hypothetical protein [Chitinophaga skermanii]